MHYAQETCRPTRNLHQKAAPNSKDAALFRASFWYQKTLKHSRPMQLHKLVTFVRMIFKKSYRRPTVKISTVFNPNFFWWRQDRIQAMLEQDVKF